MRSAVLDFKPSRRIIVIILNLERRAAAVSPRRDAVFFSLAVRGSESNGASGYRSGTAASSTSGYHDDVPSVGAREGRQGRKMRWEEELKRESKG